MGTNYYLHRDICPTCKHAKERIHIGKSSYGWTFTFQGFRNGWGPLKAESEDDWRKELKNGTIIDEYGEVETYEEFWKMVEDKRKASSNHAKEYPDGNWLDDKGNSFSSYEFS